MKAFHLDIAHLGLATVLMLSACSEQPEEGPPTEQEVHARDTAVTSRTPGRHLYRCDDDRTLLVDFKDQGLSIELRRDANAPAVVLTAPLQGLQYVGDAETATFSGNQIKIEAPAKRPVLCRKATRL